MRSVVLALALASSLLLGLGSASASAPAMTQRVTYEFVGFLDGGQQFVVKVRDENIGTKYEVYKTKKLDLVKAYPYLEGEEKKVERKIARKHGDLEPPADDATNPKKKVMMLVGQKKDKLNIYMMKGERIKKYDDIEVYQDEETNEVAAASAKQAVWSTNGKYAVVIYSVKLAQKFKTVDRDLLHAFKFKSYKVKFDGGSK